MLRKIAYITGWVLLGAYLVVTVAFTVHETAGITCREIAINDDEDQLIRLSRAEVARMVRSVDKKLIGRKLDDIDTEAIEAHLAKNSTILKADAYKLVVKDSVKYKGVVAVKVKYRKPVFRVLSSSGDFYMDESGHSFPVSINYSANVLVASGNISKEMAREELLPFVAFLEEDPFWKAQIAQVYVNGNGELLLTPLVGDQVIEFGPVDGYRKKLRNLRAFYEQVLVKNNWNKYERISVKYSNQVVAKKRK